jgi:LmbE family N-acetylglucosaminyl deacetylase
MRKIVLVFAAYLLNHSLTAQQLRPGNSAQIYNNIAQLKTVGHVLYLAAHPDDENTRLLAWLANDQHIPTAYLSLTRGDGGQNILGSEQGPALGLIRTHELMEARKIDGAEQFFTSAIDFGFSKTAEETFRHWNEYRLTSDVAWVIRKYRPDVIITRFPPDSRAGHGQHAASAVIAEKAFKVAGDKLQYTEQLHALKPWQPKRLVWNSYKFGSTNTTSEDQFKMDVGHYSPLLGMGYGELAGISRSIHRSQGAGTPSVPGVQKEYFKWVAGDTITTSLFEGIDMTWNRVGKPEIERSIDNLLKKFDFNHPESSLPQLIALRKEIGSIKDDFWRTEKLAELDKIILSASGIMAEAATRQSQAVAGSTVPFTFKIISRSSLPVVVNKIKWPAEDSTLNLTLTQDNLYSFDHSTLIPANTPATQPYWLKEPGTSGQFSIPDDSLKGFPETPPNLFAIADINIAGQQFQLPVPLSNKKLDPLRGDVVEQLRIVPAATVEILSPLIITKPDGSFNVSIRAHAFDNISKSTLNVYGNNKALLSISNLNMKANADTTIHFSTSVNTFGKNDGDSFIDVELETAGKKFNKTLKLIQYPHIPTLQYFIPPAAKVLKNDWKVTAKRIGFVEGAGEYTATFLTEAGLQVDILKDADFSDPARLKKYDAIITGIRSANTEKRMAWWMPLLLNYAREGGTLIVQYNTLQDLSTTNLGPYPLSLSGKRVTEENAKVEFINPAQRLLNFPNKITNQDFEGWVQERGLYFPEKYDEKYESLFRMNDAGEEPLTGSMLYTKLGKGNYIYSGLSFFRQLPAGNKGAIRLLMNMLSIGK